MKYTKMFAIAGAALLPIAAWANEGKANAVITKAEQSAIENILIENSKKMNKNFPLMVDAETRLDATLAIGMQFHFKYTMVNTAVKDVDVAVFRKKMEENMIKIQRADKGAVLMLKAGVEYVITYGDKNGDLIASIRLNKKICGIN
jgi:endoglucanase Acf2